MNVHAAPDIVFVGGSLAGLTLALACASRGVSVRVVERSAERRQGGDSLAIDLDQLHAATGQDPRKPPVLPVVPAYRDRVLTAWPMLYSWLLDRASATPGIRIEAGRAVASVADLGDCARLHFEDGTQQVVDAAIGADGYRSTVRSAVVPESPFARYAGYVVWRGLVDESVLPHPIARPSDAGLWIDYVGGYRLVAATLPGRDGSIAIGRRQVTFAWFDTGREALLRSSGCLTPEGHVVGTLGRGKIDEATLNELAAQVGCLWPPIWAEAVEHGLLAGSTMSGAPIAEYRPDRLVRGALALVGDAAHVVSPMTGRGFAAGVEDSVALAQCLSARRTGEPVTAVLAQYQERRLPSAQALVGTSMRLSSEFVHYAKSS